MTAVALPSFWASDATTRRWAMLFYLSTFVLSYDHMLDLRSKARQRLLAYYFTNPAARHHLRDLADRPT